LVHPRRWRQLDRLGPAPATALIGTGQDIALPSLIGAALAQVPPRRAGAVAGILTTTQQFGAASGIAVIGAVFYSALGRRLPPALSLPRWR